MKQDLWQSCCRCALVAALSLMVSCPVWAAGTYPVPETLSSQMKAVINATPVATWGLEPKSNDRLEQLQHNIDLSKAKNMSKLAKFYKVDIKADKMAGLPVYYLTPEAGVSKEKADKIVLFIHGGAYILGQGLAGIRQLPIP